MRVPPQSPSGICTLIQSDYDGPPTISLRYMYSYLICLSWSPHNLPQVYVLLSNLSMSVPPQSPTGILCTLIQSDYEGPPQSLSGICTLIQSDYEGPPQSLAGICTLIQSDYEGPPQSPSVICTLIQSDYEGPPTISLKYMYSYPICLWGSPTISLRYMYSYPIWLWGPPHILPQVYVLLSNLTMMVPPQSPSGICTLIQSDYEGPPQSPSSICTLIQSDYEGPPTISLKYMYSYAIWLWWFPHNLPQVYVLLSNLTMRVTPHNLPQV